MSHPASLHSDGSPKSRCALHLANTYQARHDCGDLLPVMLQMPAHKRQPLSGIERPGQMVRYDHRDQIESREPRC